MENEIQDISIDLIDSPDEPMRSHIDVDKLNELADSMKRIGLIQPIILRKVFDRFEVVAGHRRLKAANIAGMATIRSVIVKMDDERSDDIKIHENLFREDINPVDEGIFIAGMIDKYDYSPSEMAKKVNKSVSYVRARYELLQYPEYLIEAVGSGKVGLTASGWLIKITDERVLRDYVRFAILGGITTKRAEAWYRSWEAGQLPREPEQYKEPEETEQIEVAPLLMPCAICKQEDELEKLDMCYIHRDCYIAING